MNVQVKVYCPVFNTASKIAFFSITSLENFKTIHTILGREI